jgi:hypothetical protein
MQKMCHTILQLLDDISMIFEGSEKYCISPHIQVGYLKMAIMLL